VTVSGRTALDEQPGAAVPTFSILHFLLKKNHILPLQPKALADPKPGCGLE